MLYWLLLFVSWAAINTAVTECVLRDPLSERRHKVAYLLSVWLVPVVGALLIWLLVAYEPKRKPESGYRKLPDLAEGHPCPLSPWNGQSKSLFDVVDD